MTTLDRLLAGDMADPDGGAPLSVPTRSVVIAPSLAGMEEGLVAGLDLGRNLAVVSDPATRAALGRRLERALAAVARVRPVVLDDRPEADQATVDRLCAETVSEDALIAVGSGTVNDLCKAAAAQGGKPYAVFGTAPSMNGYTSVNASITVRGHKKSLPAVAARGVFLDLEVLAAAPPRLIRAGLGDSLCRSTAQVDWLLAHLLRDLPYREAPFALLRDDEDALFAEAAGLLAGDPEVMARLARTLVLSGFGMTICGGSYPASQGEHLISHYVEMMAPDLPAAFHGEQIGVTTLAMARLHENLLTGGPPRLAASAPGRSDVIAHFGPELGGACWREVAKKRLDVGAAEALSARLEAQWHVITARLEAVRRPTAELEGVLRAAGAPSRPADLGWPPAVYRNAVLHAREIRDRYTALDLAADAGRLERFADTEARGGAARPG